MCFDSVCAPELGFVKMVLLFLFLNSEVGRAVAWKQNWHTLTVIILWLVYCGFEGLNKFANFSVLFTRLCMYAWSDKHEILKFLCDVQMYIFVNIYMIPQE